MMKILIALLNMSIAASIVAVAVMLARIPLKKVPKIFSYALWAVVLLRLICPFGFESPTSLMPTNAEIISPAIVTAPMSKINSGIPAVDDTVNLFFENAVPLTSINPIQIFLKIGTCIWLCGLIVLILNAVIGYNRIKHIVYDATLVRDNIFETDKISTAFVLGFIRPTIYIPTVVKGKQLDYILKHEQVHIRRKDHLIKPLAFFVVAIHWFNPIVWISYYLMSKDMEMSCDEAVLRKSNEDIRQAYSTSLVNLYTRNPGLLNPLAFGEGSVKTMKARIKNVLNFKKTPRWAIVLSSFLVVLFMAGFTTNPPQSLSIDGLVNIPTSNQQSAPVTQTQQNMDSRLTLVEKEYTIAQLEAKNIRGIVVSGLTDNGEKATGVLSENIIIKTGGETLKLQYYQMSDHEYNVDDTITDGGGTRGNILIGRTKSSLSNEPERAIIITIPDNADIITLHVNTGSGDVSIENMSTLITTVKSVSGNVVIKNCDLPYDLNLQTVSGNIDVIGLSTENTYDYPYSFEANIISDSGKVLFQPKDSVSNYHFVFATKTSNSITVNGKSYNGGEFVLNENLPKTVHIGSGYIHTSKNEKQDGLGTASFIIKDNS